MTFHDPSIWCLGLLVLVPLLWWSQRSPGRRPFMTFSTTATLRAAGRTVASRLLWLVPTLRMAAIALLIVCMARPQIADEQTRVYTEGIAIQLLLDRSLSMLAPDFQLDGQEATRLDAVKQVVEDFVLGKGELPGRPDDLIGLITFASFADNLCPPTFDRGHLVDTIRQTEVANREESGTAIGDAIGLGVERLRHLEERADLNAAHRITSRVMVLLTDGENTAGVLDPLTAARLAATYDIRVYAIGAGSRNSEVTLPGARDIFNRRQTIPVSIDEETLREIAQATGGEYFRATDTESLRKIYARIDELEKTEIEQRRYARYNEPAVQSFRLGPLSLPPLMVIVFVLLGIETVLKSTRFQVVP